MPSDEIHARHGYLQSCDPSQVRRGRYALCASRRCFVRLGHDRRRIAVWCEKFGRANLLRLVEEFLARLDIFDWGIDASRHCARIQTVLKRRGTPPGNMGLLIAAHALARDVVLVTSNVKHFSMVPGLELETWAM